MGSDGQIAHGISLAVSDGTSTTTVGNITSIGGPDQSRDAIDISTMDSTNKIREFLPGLIDSGEASIDLNYDSGDGGNADSLQTLLTATVMTWTIKWAESTTTSSCSSIACAGFITRLGYAIPLGDKITQSLGVKFTGAHTFTDVPT